MSVAIRCSEGAASRSPAIAAPASVAPTSLRAFSTASSASVPSLLYFKSVIVPPNVSSRFRSVPAGVTS